MTPASAKAKGRSLQKKIAAKILETFPQLEPDDVRSCSMGSNGEDVILSPAARKLFPFSVECKKHKSFAVLKDYEQAQRHGKGEPLLIIEADRGKPIALVDLDFFLSLLPK